MAKNLNLTSSGVSATAYHDNKAAEVTPRYKASFSLTASLQLTVTFSDENTGFFNHRVGYLAVGNNGKSHTEYDMLSFGAIGETNYGYGNSRSFSANLSDLTFPITFSFICGGCGWQDMGDPLKVIEWLDDTGIYIINDARHVHDTTVSIPTIVSTTGTTVTVASDGDDIEISQTGDWYDPPHTFTGLTQGKWYDFRPRKFCPNCPDNMVGYGSSASAKTWSISGSSSDGLNSLTFTATHVAGTGGDANKTITYKLYGSQNISGTVLGTKTSASGGSVTFTGLDPNKTYYCYAYTTGINDQNGNPDNTCWISRKTKRPASVSGNTGNVSATTLRASVSWSNGDAVSVTCIASCNGQSRTISSSGGYIGFTGLTPASTYTISYTVTSTYNILDKDNKPTGKTETKEITGSFSLTTKKARFVTVNRTSKIIQFSSESVNTSETMEQQLGSDGWYSVDENELSTHNNLTHNTSYTIYCRIAGCYAFNTSGVATNVNDSVVSQSVSTYLLSLSGSISEEHQHSLVTLWQAYVNGSATNSDVIDGTQFRFTYMDTLARKSNPPYQAAEVVEGSNGRTTGNYQSDKKIYSNNLTWYYCEYIVTASITDGYNVVAAAVTAHTLFPSAWIYSGGQWHRYMGHIYTNGKWVPAPAFIYKNNNYIEPNGE